MMASSAATAGAIGMKPEEEGERQTDRRKTQEAMEAALSSVGTLISTVVGGEDPRRFDNAMRICKAGADLARTLGTRVEDFDGADDGIGFNMPAPYGHPIRPRGQMALGAIPAEADHVRMQREMIGLLAGNAPAQNLKHQVEAAEVEAAELQRLLDILASPGGNNHLILEERVVLRERVQNLILNIKQRSKNNDKPDEVVPPVELR